MKTKTLYLQEGGRCFFCRKSLRISEASIEHLIPLAKQGNDKQENMVLTCKTLNTLVRDYDLKRKLTIIFNQIGDNGFKCPQVLDEESFSPDHGT